LAAIAVAATVTKPNPVLAPAPQPNAAAPPRLPIDMDLPGAESQQHFELKQRAKWRGFRRAMAVAVVLVVTLGGLVISQSYMKLHQVFRGGAGTAAALKANVNPDLLKGEGSGRVNILLLGRGGGNPRRTGFD
jgi:hypothetical protein